MKRYWRQIQYDVVLVISLGLWLNLFLFPSQFVWAGTAMGDLAASMTPGTWAELVTNNIGTTLTNTGGTDNNIFGFTDDIVWDPSSRQLFYYGSDHIDGRPGTGPRFVSYSEATNTWTQLSNASWMSGAGLTVHGYDHHAINQATGEFYTREAKESRVFEKYNVTNKSWSALPTNNLLQYAQCCGGVDYFPELGGLVFVQGGETLGGAGGGVFLFSGSTNQWSRIGKDLSMGSYHNFAEYNPVHKVLVFGGGNNNARKMYKLTSTGQITALNDAPVSLGVNNAAIFTVDPASGDFLIFTENTQFYKYSVINDTWQLQSGSVPIWTPAHQNIGGVVATPVSNYGITLFVSCNANNCHVYLYKHTSSSSSPPIPPLSPTSLQVN